MSVTRLLGSFRVNSALLVAFSMFLACSFTANASTVSSVNAPPGHLPRNPTTAKPQAGTGVFLQFSLNYSTYQTYPGDNGYYTFPFVGSIDGSQTTETTVSSPNGGYQSSLDAGQELGNATSTVYSNFSDFESELNSTGWTLTTDADTASPTAYTFDVDASVITDIATTPVAISPGFEGAEYPAGSTPNITWTGPSDYGYLYIDVFNSTDDNAIAQCWTRAPPPGCPRRWSPEPTTSPSNTAERWTTESRPRPQSTAAANRSPTGMASRQRLKPSPTKSR